MFSTAYADALRELARRHGFDPALVRAPSEQRACLIDGEGVVWYDDWAGGAETPLVLLHGSGQSARTWDLLCSALALDRRCVAIDLPGHGRSDWSPPERYDFSTTASTLRAVLAWAGIDRCVVVGASRGGLIGLRLASSEPDLVLGLACLDIAPSVLVPTQGEPRDNSLSRWLSSRVVRRDVEDFVQLALEQRPQRDPELLRATIRNSLRRLEDGTWTWHWDPDLFAGSRDGAREAERLTRDARVLIRPLLVVQGRHSDMVTLPQAQEFANLARDGEVLALADAGHNIPGDNPLGLLHLLRSWFARAVDTDGGP